MPQIGFSYQIKRLYPDRYSQKCIHKIRNLRSAYFPLPETIHIRFPNSPVSSSLQLLYHAVSFTTNLLRCQRHFCFILEIRRIFSRSSIILAWIEKIDNLFTSTFLRTKSTLCQFINFVTHFADILSVMGDTDNGSTKIFQHIPDHRIRKR